MHKIFFFESGTTGWGGSFKSCYFMASDLKKRGYFVIVGYLNSSNYWKKLEFENILTKRFSHKLYSNKIKNSFWNKLLRRIDEYAKILLFPFDNKIHKKFISEAAKFIKEKKINLIHSNTNYIRDIEIFKLAKRMGLPIVCHLRMEPYRKLTFFEKKNAQYEKACFIAISKAVRHKWITAGLPKEKIKLIYNAQPQLNLIQAKNSINYSNHFPVKILFAGRLSKIKGVDVLIDALAKISKSKWRLSIVGEGEEKNHLITLVKNKKLKENIIFYGYQRTIEDFYASHDVVVVASHKEPFGRVIIEAMQFGVPIVASNIDGPAEIIENGKDGILFSVGNVNKLKKALEILINNSDKRRRIGLAGKEKQKKFSEKVFITKLLKIYNEFLDKNERESIKKKIRACFISIKTYPLFNSKRKDITFGGAEVQMYQLADRLSSDKGYKVYFVVGDFDQLDNEKHKNIEVIKAMKLCRKWIIFSGIKEQLKLCKILKSINADIYIQRAAGMETFIAAFFCKLFRKKFIYMVANRPDVDGSFRKKNQLIGWFYEKGLKMADAVIAQNNDQQKLLLKNFKRKSVLIKNSFYLGKEIENTNRESILWVASSRPQKKPDIFLKLAKDFPEEKFIMIMPKSDMGLWDKIHLKASGIENLEFIEKIPFDKIGEYFMKVRVFVNTSSYEGFPNTFIQAAMHGTPIISLSVNPDNFIDNYKCGYIARGDYDKMKIQLKELIKNEELWENFSKNAYLYVKKNHDIEKNIIDFKKVINQL